MVIDMNSSFYSIYSHGFIRVAVAIPSVRVADCKYNVERTLHLARRASESHIAIILFPELGISAYSNKDLFHQDALLDDDGLIDILALMDMLALREVNNVMVEGGAIVITSFIRLKLVDLFVITVAPKLVGGFPMIDARRIKNASHLALTDIHYQRLGGDLVVWARPIWSNDEA